MKKNINVVVKKSKIHGKGVFANRDFKKGEIILKWKPKILKESEIQKLSARERHYIYKDKKGKYFLMRAPEKYVNHSCEANTKVKNNCDVVIKHIRKGEEITSDYDTEVSFISFICKCGSKRCRGTIKGK